jgi:TonB-linked SusC/RagA family outer membrane protein
MKKNYSLGNHLTGKVPIKHFLLIMRTTVILLFTCVFCSMAETGHSQNARVTINKRNSTLREVLNEIEKQTDYLFIYNNEVNTNAKVSIRSKQEAVSKILNSLLKDKDLSYSMEGNHIIIAVKGQTEEDIKTEITVAQQQRKRITGTVTEANGEPVIGANIIEEGTTNGTVTDIDGNFFLNVENNSVIHISYIGYLPQEINTVGKTTFDIILQEDTKALDELVVVGYGTVKKKDLTGSVASVSAETISSSPSTSAIQAIQGRIPGMYISNSTTKPGESASVIIRGKRSISGSSDPLYIVDGIAIVGGLNEINPADIESVDVLKDASATAIYGARGSNGVIIITTKKGREGKTQVEYNGYVGFQSVLNELEFMDGAAYAETVRESYRANGKYHSSTPSWEEDQKIGSFANDPYTLESLRMAYDSNGNYDPSKVRSDSKWWEAVQRTGMITNHQLSIRGGSEKTSFTFSGGYYQNRGLVKDEEYSRYSIRQNLEHSVNKHIKFGANNSFSQTVQERGSTLFNSWRVMPMGRFYDDEGELLEKVSGTDDQWRNPLLKLANGAVDKPLKVNRFIGSYYADITLPLDGVRFRTNLGLDSRATQDYDFQNAASRGTTMNYAKNATDNRFMFTWENLLFYDKSVQDHTFGVTLLQSIQEYLREYNNISVQGTPADELLYYDVGSASTPNKSDSGKTQWRLASFMARLNYGFKGRYLATLSARYDGSSRLAKGHQWVAFPAVALAWRINEESFMQNISSVSNLKLRLGYGTVASSEVDPYETKGTLSQIPYNYGDEMVFGYAPNKMPNTTLTWEKTGQWNAGVDFGFFNNRLNGTVDVYLQNTKDLLLNRQLPVVSGFNEIRSNVGKTRNKGIELTLNSLNIIKKDFSWSTDFIAYVNKEEIVSPL